MKQVPKTRLEKRADVWTGKHRLSIHTNYIDFFVKGTTHRVARHDGDMSCTMKLRARYRFDKIRINKFGIFFEKDEDIDYESYCWHPYNIGLMSKNNIVAFLPWKQN